MDAWKIQHYEKELGTPFPPFRSLSEQETHDLRSHLAAIHDIAPASSLLEFTINIANKATFLESLNADDETFDLSSVFEKLGIPLPEKIHINWYRYDRVDEMNTADLVKSFDWIWYPVAEDIDLIDPQGKWIISVNHEGYISALP